MVVEYCPLIGFNVKLPLTWDLRQCNDPLETRHKSVTACLVTYIVVTTMSPRRRGVHLRRRYAGKIARLELPPAVGLKF